MLENQTNGFDDGDELMKLLEELWSEDVNDVPLYATDETQQAFARQFLPSIELFTAGGFFPFQAEGKLDGWPFYLRIEDDCVSLSVALTMNDCYLNEDALWGAGMALSGDLREVWPKGLVESVRHLETYKRRFSFGSDPMPGKEGWYSGMSEPSVTGFGVDADEAWEAAKVHALDTSWIDYRMERYGENLKEFKKEWVEHQQWLLDHAHKDRILNPDTRVFPDQLPFFEVLTPFGYRADGTVNGTLPGEIEAAS